MASGAKYFVVNRESDWRESGVISNLTFKDDVLSSKNNGENGVYISKAFDSGQNETVWHRLRLDMDVPVGGIVRLRLYAGDDEKAIAPSVTGKGVSEIIIDDFITDDGIDVNRKIDVLDYIGAKKYENSNDVLMFDLKGRYLWVCIETINYHKNRIRVRSMKVEFPRVTFVDYLPDIYKEQMEENSFIARFVGIFQSIYVDLEDRIDVTPIHFDTEITNKEFLNWISDWLSVKDPSIWGEKKLRTLVKEAVKIYKMKGTKKSIAKIVKEYAGTEPIIVERFDVTHNEYYDRQKEHVDGLFGDNGYVFSVILSDKYVEDAERYVELLRVINGVAPIDSICNLVVLNDRIYLDHHCYMGMNSYIDQGKEIIMSTGGKSTGALTDGASEGGAESKRRSRK